MAQAHIGIEAGGEPAGGRARERGILGLISAGHFLSHFYALLLPPLFPLLKAEFGVSYAELGLAVTAYALLGGILQAPVGVLVDRQSASRVLIAGLVLNAGAILLIGVTDAFWLLLGLSLLAGIGNSVFHPADYAILSRGIDERRLGRAYAVHTFSGFLGGACAPVAVLAMIQWMDWRDALVLFGLIGFVVAGAMLLRQRLLDGLAAGEAGAAAAKPAPGRLAEELRILARSPILLFLAFFVFYGISSGGLLAFTASGLIDLLDFGLDAANLALTGHLFGVVIGIAGAGVIVDRYRNHVATISLSLLLAALAAVLPVTLALPEAGVIAAMTVAGIGLGAALPARDLQLKAIIPADSVGKVFGFVFVGYSLGISIAPPIFGLVLDSGEPAWVFWLAGLFALLAIAAVAASGRLSKPPYRLKEPKP